MHSTTLGQHLIHQVPFRNGVLGYEKCTNTSVKLLSLGPDHELKAYRIESQKPQKSSRKASGQCQGCREEVLQSLLLIAYCRPFCLIPDLHRVLLVFFPPVCAYQLEMMQKPILMMRLNQILNVNSAYQAYSRPLQLFGVGHPSPWEWFWAEYISLTGWPFGPWAPQCSDWGSAIPQTTSVPWIAPTAGPSAPFNVTLSHAVQQTHPG